MFFNYKGIQNLSYYIKFMNKIIVQNLGMIKNKKLFIITEKEDSQVET